MKAAPFSMVTNASPVIFPIFDLIDILDVILANDHTVTKQRTEPHNFIVLSMTFFVRIRGWHLCHPPVFDQLKDRS
jgi:hypothetical protein